MRCPNDNNRTTTGGSLCAECGDRLWQELHWLADMYDHLFQALTHRLNVEKAEQVKVHGGKDPMVRGMDLNDDAANLRHTIRGVAYAGLGWLYQRNPDFRGAVEAMDIPITLRFLARHLHWITSDQDPGRIKGWGSRVVEARTNAEILVTPASAHPIRIHGYTCQHWAVGMDGETVACGSAVHTYREDTSVVLCDLNPSHTVPRETAIRQAVAHRAKAAPTRRLIQAILTPTTKGTGTK